MLFITSGDGYPRHGESTLNHPLSSALQKTVESWQYFAPCLGANISVYDSQNGYWNSSTGFKAINPTLPLQPDERFYIYSITKTFTAIVIMQLVQRNLISLDAPISKYLTSLRLPQCVSVRRLLNHTSGIANYTELPDYGSATKERPAEPWTFEYVIERTCTEEPDFEPGDQWHYSNTGYMLLLLMIESVTGLSYSKNVDKLITRKIGLKNTYVAENVDQGKVTPGYCRYLNDEEKMENITGIYNPWWCKTGLMVSTTFEITKLFKDLFTGALIDAELLGTMTEPTPITESTGQHFAKPSYGLGLMIDPDSAYGEMYGHGGDGPGFNTWSAYYPDFFGRSAGVTVFCNTSMGGHPYFLVKDILKVLKTA